jgi:hypothetical protein
LPAFRLSSDRTFLSRAGWQANKKYEYEKRERGRRNTHSHLVGLRGAGDGDGAEAGGLAVHALQQITGSRAVSTTFLA